MIAADVAIGFRPLQRSDEALLRTWLAQPHVARWWPDADAQAREAMSTIDDGGADAFIIQGNGHDIGYIQASDAFHDSYFSDRRKGARGIDLYLGYADLVGKGLGTRVIREFSGWLLTQGVPEIVADPDPKNSGAFTACKNAGFTPYRVHRSPEHGHLILMFRTA